MYKIIIYQRNREIHLFATYLLEPIVLRSCSVYGHMAARKRNKFSFKVFKATERIEQEKNFLCVQMAYLKLQPHICLPSLVKNDA